MIIHKNDCRVEYSLTNSALGWLTQVSEAWRKTKQHVKRTAQQVPSFSPFMGNLCSVSQTLWDRGLV